MHIAIVMTNTNSEPTALIADMGDRYLLERLEELSTAPDPSAPVPVRLSTGGIWEIEGDAILAAFEVQPGSNAADALANWQARQAADF